jgi:hypothetical protein
MPDTAMRSTLRAQFLRACQLGWIPFFEEAASRYKQDAATILALASRETNLDPQYLKIRGDHGHGYGLLQVDDRSFPTWCASGAWRDARQSILKGAMILQSKEKSLVDRGGQTVRVTTHDAQTTRTFTMPFLSGNDLARLAIASYNGGDWPVYHYARGRDCDEGTTQQNYSFDVLARASYFRTLLKQRCEDLAKAHASFLPKPEPAPEPAPTPAKIDTPVNLAPPEPSTASVIDEATTVPAGPTIGSGLKAFAKLLLGGYKRGIGWLTGMAITFDNGIIERHPSIVLVGLAAIAIGFWYFYQKVHKVKK